MYRRKRRNRGTWLPTLGTQRSEDDTYLWGFGSTMAIPGTGLAATDIETAVIPITADNPTYQGDNVGQQVTMAEVIGNEYFLDRIVGKLFLNYAPALNASGDAVSRVLLVAAGFFIARADDANPLLPVGADTPAELRDNYSPLDVDTSREPWIWRRAWMLGTSGNQNLAPNSGTSGNRIVGAWPTSNWLYGSVLDGPHIDAKTKRRVGQDDRLWFAISNSFTPFFGDYDGTPQTSGTLLFWLDYRLHGGLRKARSSGRF